MIEILVWVFMTVLTQLSKKTKISQTYLIGWMCILWGIMYTIIDYKNPDVLVKAWEFMTKAFATSQWIYMTLSKLGILKK